MNVVIKKQSKDCYIVFYDKEVVCGRISRHNNYFYFYPEDIDGLGGHTLLTIVRKINELEQVIRIPEFA